MPNIAQPPKNLNGNAGKQQHYLTNELGTQPKTNYDYVIARLQIEADKKNPYKILRMVKVEIIQNTLCSKVNELGPVTIIQLLPFIKEEARLVAYCLNKIESLGWIKVLFVQAGCKHYVKHNWKEPIQ